MNGRVIQGFFAGGARLAPRTGARAGHGGASVDMAGGARTVQRHARPGPPSLVHAAGSASTAPTGGRAALQGFGGDGSFAVDPAQVGLVRSGGDPLPGALLAKMEAALGADFSGVRVHVGPQAARIGALAFTTGNDLYFAPGQYQPDSVKGQQLIGHELAHVIQQRQGRVRAPGSGVAVVQDRALEAEADRLGMQAALMSAAQAPVVAQPKLVAPPHGATIQLQKHNRKLAPRTRGQDRRELATNPKLDKRNILNKRRIRYRPDKYGVGDGTWTGIGSGATYSGIPTRNVTRVFSAKDKAAVNALGNSYGCHQCRVMGVSGHPDGHWTPDHQPPLSLWRARHGDLVNYRGQLYPHCKACSSRQGGLRAGGYV